MEIIFKKEVVSDRVKVAFKGDPFTLKAGSEVISYNGNDLHLKLGGDSMIWKNGEDISNKDMALGLVILTTLEMLKLEDDKDDNNLENYCVDTEMHLKNGEVLKTSICPDNSINIKSISTPIQIGDTRIDAPTKLDPIESTYLALYLKDHVLYTVMDLWDFQITTWE